MLEELAIKYGTDKSSKGHGYTKYYSQFFDSIKNDRLNILELGVREGWSLKMWHEYFTNSIIWGIDNNFENKCPEKFDEKRINFRIGSQDDKEFLNNLVKESGVFDIIIDDCSHISDLTIASFEILWPHLKTGGIYVIEDLHVCNLAPTYLRFGPSALNYLKNIDKQLIGIKTMNIYENKICFIRK